MLIFCPPFCICSEADEIHKICSVIGSPTEDSWAEGLKLASNIIYQFPEVGSSFLAIMIFFLADCFFQLKYGVIEMVAGDPVIFIFLLFY